MQPFDDLTLRGRAERLRQMALSALEQYDLDVTRVRLIQAFFNAIYRVDVADGTKYVIRVSLPDHRTPDEIQAEARWLAALRRDLALTVPEPLLNRAGDLVTVAAHPGVPEARRCVVFSWIPGSQLAEHIAPDTLYKHGVLTARLHQHAAGFALPPGLHIKSFNTPFPYNEDVVLFEGEYARKLTPDDRANARLIADRAQIMLDRLLNSGQAPRMIHADLHQWNIKVFRGELYVLDFDDTMYGYPVQDIGIMLYYIHRRDDYLALYGAFRRGYESVLPWPEQHPAEVETWIAWRAIDLLNFVLQSKSDEGHVAILTEKAARCAATLRAYI